MTTCVIVLKSGKEIRIKCDRFEIVKDNNIGIKEFRFYNAFENELQFVHYAEIAAVYRIKESGKEGEADG